MRCPNHCQPDPRGVYRVVDGSVEIGGGTLTAHSTCSQCLGAGFIEGYPPPQIDFVRMSDTPETFDGRWMVWVGTVCYGTVSKDDDPPHRSRPWGYAAKQQVRCRAGYRTRKDAGLALITLAQCGVLSCNELAVKKIGNSRGESLPVCPEHLVLMRAQLVGPVERSL